MSVLYIVHCIDTEGPLEETLAGTFERLRQEKLHRLTQVMYPYCKELQIFFLE